MNRPLLTNILSSFTDKAFAAATLFAATVLVVRLLPREDYGVMGVAAGCGALIQILNLSLESIILRDHRTHTAHPERFLLSFIAFNLAKAVPICLLVLGLGAALASMHSQPDFLWAMGSVGALVIAESIVAPFVVYASAQYQQRLVTALNIGRFSLNLVLLAGLLKWPTLTYLFVKDIAVMIALLLAWWIASRRVLALDFSRVSFRRDVSIPFIRDTLMSYSLWVHLTSVCTTFVYRADTIFLSCFAPLATVGNYNVALSGANVANIAPSILGYQNSVALSYARDRQEAFRLTDLFLRMSVYIGGITLVAFCVLGIPYLQLVTGQDHVSEMYVYLVCIVGGLVVAKTAASPLAAYVNVKGDVKSMFLRVTLPVALLTAVSYYCAARWFGAFGVAASNLLNGAIWLALLWKETRRYGYRLPAWSGYVGDLQRVQGWLAR